MDGYNPIRAALTAAPEADEGQPVNAIRAAASGDASHYAKDVLRQATENRWNWEQTKRGLSEVGANPDDYKHLEQSANLNAAKKELAGTGIGVGTSFRRDYMPFSSLSSANFLAGPGGRVVGASEYSAATERFKKGEATEADTQTIALYEHHAEVDAKAKSQARLSALWGDATGEAFANRFGGKLLLELGSLGKIGAEAAIGGQILRPLAGARAIPAAAAGAAPAVPAAAEAAATASGLRSAAGYAAGKLPVTLTTPSLYVPMAQQNNMANGRAANDWKGYPTALGYGYANMLVLGQLQKGVNGPIAVDAFRRGVLATAEMQGVDAAAGLADEFLPKAYKVKPSGEGNYGAIGAWLSGPRGGSAEKSDEFLRDVSIQALSFGAFGAMHGRPQKGTDLAQSYADTFAALRDRGMGKEQAAQKIAALHDGLEIELSRDPFLTKEKAAAALKGLADKDTEAYAAKLADVFEPQAAVPAAHSVADVPQPSTAIDRKYTPEPTLPRGPAEPEVQKVSTQPPADAYTKLAQEVQSLVDQGTPVVEAVRKVRADHPELFGPRGQVAAAASPKQLAGARQPTETAATPPEALGVAPESRGVETSNRPSEPEIGPPAQRGATGEPLLHVPDYKTPGSNLSAARKLLLGPFAGKWFSRGREQNEGYFSDGKFQVEFDAARLSDEAGGDFVEHRLKEVGVGSKTPMYLHPALKAIRFRGKAEGADYAEMESLVRDVNEERTKAGLEPVTLEGTERRKAQSESHPGRRVSDQPAAAAAQSKTTSEKVKPPDAPAASVKVAPPSEARPSGTGTPHERLLADLREAATRTEDPVARDYLESALDNHSPDVRNAPLDLVRQLADSWRQAMDKGESASVRDQIATALKRAGGEWHGPDVGETTVFSGKYHESLSGTGPGDRVTIARRPIVFRDAAGEHVAAKGIVSTEKPAAAATPPAAPPERPPAEPNRSAPADAAIREQWDSMDAAERKSVLDDPAARKFYEDAGINVGTGAREATRQERNRQGKAGAVGATGAGERDAGDFRAIVDNSDLSVSERHAALGVAAGWSIAKIATKTGMSKGGVHKAGVRAVKKLAARAIERLFADAEGDPNRQEEIRKLAQEISELSEDSKPASLETVIRALSGFDAVARVEAREARGTVEIDEFGRVKHGEGEAYFGGFPFKIAFLEGIFGKAGTSQRTIWQRLSGLFFGELPSAARAAKQQELDQRIAAYAYDVKNAERDLKAALRRTGTPLDSLKPADVKRLDDLLRVDPSRTAAEAARLGVHPEVADVIRQMRQQVDSLSDTLVGVGAIDGPLIATVQGNVGAYLTRQYQVFSDPAWEAKVDPAVVNRFKSWLVAELAKAGVAWPADRIDAEVKKLLRDGTAAENPIAFLKNTVLGAKDLSILKARQDIPPELRALWGEYEDPLINYVNSVGKMAHLLSSHLFLTRVAGEGLGEFLFQEPTQKDGQDFVHQFDTKNFAAFAPLEGLHTTKEIKAAFENAYSDRVTSAAMKLYSKVMAMAKFSKTVLSLPGQARNFLSNIFVVMRNGLWQAGHMPGVFAEVFSDTPAARDYWRKLTQLGIVGEGVHYQDFRQTVEDAMGTRDALRKSDGLIAIDTLFGRMVRAGSEAAQRLYHYGDSIWKVYAFEAEKARYEKAGFSPDEAETKAVQIVRDTMPTYSNIPESLQKLRRLPLVAPFISFQAEMVRTTKNTVKQILSDWKDPRTRGIAATRLAGLTAAAALPWAAAALTRAMFGVDDDEEKAIRRHLPDWQKESRLAYFGRQPNGQVNYLDVSKTDAHSYITDGLLALWRGGWTNPKALSAAADEWSKPFTQEELLVRPALDIARNTKEPGGRVYNPQADARQQALEIGKHAMKPFEPGGYQALRRLYLSFTGEAEQKSGKTYDPGYAPLENFSGQRVEPLDVERSLTGKAQGFREKERAANQMVQEMIHSKGMVRPEELSVARQATEDGRKKAMDEFREDILAAERLGVSRGRITKLLRDAGLTQADITQLLTGTQRPYLPQPTGPQTERERAGSVRSQAVSSGRP